MLSLKNLGKKAIPVAAISALLLATAAPASAATLTNVSVSPSTGRAGATAVTYTITASNITTSAIQCILVEFDNSADGTGGKPAGMTLPGSTSLGGSSTLIPAPASFTATPDNAAGTVRFTGAGQTPASSGPRTIVVTNITNPNANSYYMLLKTFNNADCLSSPVDTATAQFVTTTGTNVTVNVDPSFSFAVIGTAAATTCNTVASSRLTTPTAVDFGRVTAGNSAVGVQNLEVDSNASGGYVVYAKTASALTAGVETIPDFASASPAVFPTTSTAAFGFFSGDANLTTPVPSGQYVGNLATVAAPGHQVAVGPSGTVYTDDTTCVGFRVNVSSATKAGAYATVLTYTAVPTF